MATVVTTLNYLTSTYTNTTTLDAALAAKQATLSVGAGAFLAGVTLSGYNL